MEELISKGRETSRRVKITPLSENVAISSTIWQSYFIQFPLICLFHPSWLPDAFSACFLTEPCPVWWEVSWTHLDHHVEQKEVGKECQPSAIAPAQRLI